MATLRGFVLRYEAVIRWLSVRRRALATGAVVLGVAIFGLGVLLLVAQGPAPRRGSVPGGMVFAVLGDAPYTAFDERRYTFLLEDIDAHQLSWVIHVGDTMIPPCTDARYFQRLGWFESSRHPVIYTPGDNEWTDCANPRTGALRPLDRLNRLRQIYFSRPEASLGRRRLPLVHQGAPGSAFPELVENARWEAGGVVWATIHLVGSRNGRKPFPGRTAASDRESIRRTEGAVAWLKETFVRAGSTRAQAVVIATHADLALDNPLTDPRRSSFEPFLRTLEEEVEHFGRPVLLVHGDFHQYLVDQPLVRRTTGQRLANFTRLQVPGFPDVGWVRVVVDPGKRFSPRRPAGPFTFEKRVVSPLRYWW